MFGTVVNFCVLVGRPEAAADGSSHARARDAAQVSELVTRVRSSMSHPKTFVRATRPTFLCTALKNNILINLSNYNTISNNR